VAGEANPTFEQNLVVRLVSADGEELALQPTTIQADLGNRGPFEIEIPFNVSGEQNAFIQVFSQSPRDGAIEHLSSVNVRLADSGPEDIRPATSGPERIAILEPEQGATISGGVVHVEGFGLASFEQTLVVDLLDAEGNTLAREPLTVEAPDLGQPGPFSVDLSYNISAGTPARVVVRDPSPAFNGTVHLNSVTVRLEP
ncbi:MAG: Gmad2 immunoglobulin-like domain-containing protein, partial [Chloroflexota bacterium]|nr:Gmad2 immunoglobulin-like domain-containing protein [Chloroflexota bacterium]